VVISLHEDLGKQCIASPNPVKCAKGYNRKQYLETPKEAEGFLMIIHST